MKVEVRADKITISGYVNAVERDSKVLPANFLSGMSKPFKECIRAGTFAKAIKTSNNILIKFNHGRKIGSIADGTLFLREDTIGLYARAVISDTEVISEAKKGNLTGWSFGMIVNHDEINDKGTEMHRIIDNITLTEVSVLTVSPAYAGTSIEMRGESIKTTEVRSIEDKTEIPFDDTDMKNKQIEILKEKIKYES